MIIKNTFFKLFIMIIISSILGLTSCINTLNTSNSTVEKNNLINKSLIKTTNFQTKAEPQILNFESKVPIQNYSITQNLPSGTYYQFNLRVNGNMKDSIKIASISDFILTIQAGNNFQIIDNDATDGNAIVQLPIGNLEGFLTVIKDASGKQTGSIILEDELYYVKQELKELETSNKGGVHNLTSDYWYNLKKRSFPVSQNWGNPNGDKHVFKFSNKGIKQLMFRWYSANNIDYPLGVSELGINGGVIELPNVGKLEIPQGALSKNTIISLRQILQAYEVFDPAEIYGKIYDYASPILKIEPINLELLEPAKIYLETNLERLGNNSPYSLRVFGSNDIKYWYQLEYFVDNIYNLNIQSPIKTRKFGYFSKQILASTSPTDNLKTTIIDIEDVSLEENSESKNFNIKSVNNKHILVDTDNQLTFKQEEELSNRIRNSYTYFKKVSGDDPVSKRNIYIRIYSYDMDGKTYSDGTILLSYNLSGLEHELWHLFQFSLENFSYLYATKTIAKNRWWVHESAAEYMGASVFKKYTSKFTTYNQIKDNYQERLEESLNEIEKDFPYSSISDIYYNYSKLYLGVGYLTYLANINGTDGISQDRIMNNIINTVSMDKFHDYVLHAYLEDKFHIYKPYGQEKYIFKNKLINQEINLDNTALGNPLRIGGTLNNNSAVFYKIYSNDLRINNNKLKISLLQQTGKNNIKLKVLKYKNSATDPNEKIGVISENNGSEWIELSGFKKDFDYVVLVVSNSDGTFSSNNSWFQILAGIPKTITLPGRNDNIVLSINNSQAKGNSYFWYNDVRRISNIFGYLSLSHNGETGEPRVRPNCTTDSNGNLITGIAQTERYGSLSLSFNLLTNTDIGNKTTIIGTLSGEYRAFDKPLWWTATACYNWIGYGIEYRVPSIAGTVTLSYSKDTKLINVSGNYNGLGKKKYCGFYSSGCGSESEILTNALDFSLNENFSYTVPTSELEI